MILTFPNLGNVSVLLSVLMREWGIPFIAPPKTTKNTVAAGSRYAPSDACLPMKIILGNFIEGYHAGADTAVFPAGNGPCLFGCFSEMIRLALEENSIPLDILRLELSRDCVTDLYEQINKISGKNLAELLSPLREGARSCFLLDKLESRFLLVRSTIEDEKVRKDFTAFEDGVFFLLKNAQSFIELTELINAAIDKSELFIGERQTILTVGIVGDIYTTIDGDANLNLQKQLANMGVYSERSMTISKWFKDKLPISPFGWRWYARPYIQKNIGGFARQTVGYAAMWSQSVDGIIQIHPLNCMPEVVAASVLRSTSRELGVPFLSLVLDELSGESGYITRIEAFYDLLEAKNKNDELLARR